MTMTFQTVPRGRSTFVEINDDNVSVNSTKNYYREKQKLYRELSQTFKSNNTIYGRINVLEKREQ